MWSCMLPISCIAPAWRAVFCAKVVADQLNRGIFEAYLTDACVPFIPEPMTSSRVAAVTNALTVRDVMATGVTALPPVVEASRLVDLLKRHSYAVRVAAVMEILPTRLPSTC